MLDYARLAPQIARSGFRRRFRLRDADLRYLARHGFPAVEAQCETFVRQRLAPAVIPNEGRQTPWKGHPCFPAQHATACCCRGCLQKWHGIPPGRDLTEAEIAAIVRLLLEWIRAHADGLEALPTTPDLF